VSQLQLYTEHLTAEEFAFIQATELRNRAMYFKVFRLLMIVSFVLPFITAWYRAYDGAPNAFSYPRFFLSAGILVFISAFSTYMSYRVYHRGLQKDMRFRTKTIETCHITKKVYVEVDQTCYLYLSSPTRLSIQVSADDYLSYSDGDEVSIEYATHSKEYLGYF